MGLSENRLPPKKNDSREHHVPPLFTGHLGGIPRFKDHPRPDGRRDEHRKGRLGLNSRSAWPGMLNGTAIGSIESSQGLGVFYIYIILYIYIIFFFTSYIHIYLKKHINKYLLLYLSLPHYPDEWHGFCQASLVAGKSIRLPWFTGMKVWWKNMGSKWFQCLQCLEIPHLWGYRFMMFYGFYREFHLYLILNVFWAGAENSVWIGWTVLLIGIRITHDQNLKETNQKMHVVYIYMILIFIDYVWP